MPAVMSTKLVVSNRGALKAKYGAAGFTAIEKALKQMVAADAKRSIRTVIVYLDDKSLGAKAVKTPDNPKQNKVAVDAIIAKTGEPDYLMILGAPDVVAFQQLKNTIDGDEDADVPSDLPYACTAAYSTNMSAFVGPTRVVGRLPDLRGGNVAAEFVKLIANATSAAPMASVAAYFAVTAAVWKVSTQLSLQSIFGSAASLKIAPPQTSTYGPNTLSAPMHFVNCHGSPADPQFYGQSGSSYPVAMHAQQLGGGAGGVTTGCVAAFECCYGAELYPPAMAGNVASIADTYLAGGAYGVLGSTTIAYGPATTNDLADILCATFLIRVRAGASLGRALLEARQDYVASRSVMSPTDLKTLAQFVLLGDPSIQPVAATDAPPHAVLAATSKSFGGAGAVDVIARTSRRSKLAQFGAAIGAVTPRASGTQTKTSAKVQKALEALLASDASDTASDAAAPQAKAMRRSAGPVRFSTYSVSGGSAKSVTFASMGKGKSASGVPETIHLAVEPLTTIGKGTWYKISEIHEVNGNLLPRAVAYSR
ncbi:MAG: C25 family cysteine peptidase [Tepidisphaeraceae bacterium]